MKNVKGSLILLITAFIWGSAFVAQTTGASHIGAFTFNASRCFVGALFLFVLSFVRSKAADKKANTREDRKMVSRCPIKGGILCGLALFFAMSLQQLGISVYPDNVAVAGRAGFITAVYVVLVALCEQFRGRKLHFLVIVSVFLTMLGMYFLCLSDGISNIYLGDILILGCAICFTVHILVIDNFKGEDSVKLSCLQFFVCGTLSLICSLPVESVNLMDLKAGLFSILYAGVFSSGIAYTLQMVGQKYAEPAVASIVMSLESVFAALTGWVVLHELLSGRELVGCALVFVSVVLAQLPQFIRRNNA